MPAPVIAPSQRSASARSRLLTTAQAAALTTATTVRDARQALAGSSWAVLAAEAAARGLDVADATPAADLIATIARDAIARSRGLIDLDDDAQLRHVAEDYAALVRTHSQALARVRAQRRAARNTEDAVGALRNAEAARDSFAVDVLDRTRHVADLRRWNALQKAIEERHGYGIPPLPARIPRHSDAHDQAAPSTSEGADAAHTHGRGCAADQISSSAGAASHRRRGIQPPTLEVAAPVPDVPGPQDAVQHSSRSSLMALPGPHRLDSPTVRTTAGGARAPHLSRSPVDSPPRRPRDHTDRPLRPADLRRIAGGDGQVRTPHGPGLLLDIAGPGGRVFVAIRNNLDDGSQFTVLALHPSHLRRPTPEDHDPAVATVNNTLAAARRQEEADRQTAAAADRDARRVRMSAASGRPVSPQEVLRRERAAQPLPDAARDAFQETRQRILRDLDDAERRGQLDTSTVAAIENAGGRSAYATQQAHADVAAQYRLGSSPTARFDGTRNRRQ
ncbi:hypothetical protein [Frankia sp. AiPs1]|uniref:hypothetical protein n=1 Tax=Frankia sp. AiPs1 TaxID=573493 RepID=UPI00255AA0DD|nr:hypothetical protein [Frankia sp. AiPs1]